MVNKNGCAITILHDAVECLIAALEAKDIYTCGHSNRVSNMAVILAEDIGIGGLELEKIHIAAHLHDIGKIGIPDSILNKSGRLLTEEWEAIKKHPIIGYEILKKSEKLKDIATIVLHHHERWDGNGYPYNLCGNNIPLGSRIIAVCDAIDAMASSRPYRRPLRDDEIIKEIHANKGLQFDPFLIEKLDFYRIYECA